MTLVRRVLVLATLSLMPLAACNRAAQDTAAAPLAAAPTLTAIEPADAPPHGLAIAHIVGEGFDPKLPVTVTFGHTPSPRAAVVTKSRIQVEVPPGQLGSEVEVRVELAGHAPATVPGKFRYVAE